MSIYDPSPSLASVADPPSGGAGGGGGGDELMGFVFCCVVLLEAEFSQLTVRLRSTDYLVAHHVFGADVALARSACATTNGL